MLDESSSETPVSRMPLTGKHFKSDSSACNRVSVDNISARQSADVKRLANRRGIVSCTERATMCTCMCSAPCALLPHLQHSQMNPASLSLRLSGVTQDQDNTDGISPGVCESPKTPSLPRWQARRNIRKGGRIRKLWDSGEWALAQQRLSPPCDDLTAPTVETLELLPPRYWMPPKAVHVTAGRPSSRFAPSE